MINTRLQIVLILEHLNKFCCHYKKNTIYLLFFFLRKNINITKKELINRFVYAFLKTNDRFQNEKLFIEFQKQNPSRNRH